MIQKWKSTKNEPKIKLPPVFESKKPSAKRCLVTFATYITYLIVAKTIDITTSARKITLILDTMIAIIITRNTFAPTFKQTNSNSMSFLFCHSLIILPFQHNQSMNPANKGKPSGQNQ